MPDTIKTGTILIKEGTLLPEEVRFETEPYVPGWRSVKNLDGYGLGREIHEAGWTSFCLAGETKVTVFGIDGEKMVRRAIERILANPKSEKFNSLEIVQVALAASKRFLGVRYVTVSAQSRHIQESFFSSLPRTFRSGTEQGWLPPEPKHRVHKGQGTASGRDAG